MTRFDLKSNAAILASALFLLVIGNEIIGKANTDAVGLFGLMLCTIALGLICLFAWRNMP